jgi:hypothetical protein
MTQDKDNGPTWTKQRPDEGKTTARRRQTRRSENEKNRRKRQPDEGEKRPDVGKQRDNETQNSLTKAKPNPKQLSSSLLQAHPRAVGPLPPPSPGNHHRHQPVPQAVLILKSSQPLKARAPPLGHSPGVVLCGFVGWVGKVWPRSPRTARRRQDEMTEATARRRQTTARRGQNNGPTEANKEVESVGSSKRTRFEYEEKWVWESTPNLKASRFRVRILPQRGDKRSSQTVTHGSQRVLSSVTALRPGSILVMTYVVN